MPNWKKVIVSGSDAILNSITSSAGILSNGNLTVEGGFTASLLSGYAWVGGPGGLNTQIPTSSFAGSVTITNDFSNRVLTSNGDGTLNAESGVTYDGTLFSVGPSVLATTNIGRAFYAVDTSGYNYLIMGDNDQVGNATRLEISDQLGKINFHVGNPDPHYFNNELLFVSGAVSSSDLYVDNKFNSTAIFTGPLVTQTSFTTPGVNTGTLTGNFLSNNGNDRVITSNGNGTFTAESGLRFTTNGLYVEKDTNIDGDLSVTGNIIAQQYIVSSSVTYITQSFSSGSTIFGDSLDDTHQFTGSVDITDSLNASGNISASGYVSADYLTLNITSSNYDIDDPYVISLSPNERTREGYIERIFDLSGLNPGDPEYGFTGKEIFSISEINTISLDYSITVYGGNVGTPSIATNDTASILVSGQFFATNNELGVVPVNLVPISYNYPNASHVSAFNTFYNQGRGYIIYDYNASSFKINNLGGIDNINTYTSGSLVIVNINYKATK